VTVATIARVTSLRRLAPLVLIPLLAFAASCGSADSSTPKSSGKAECTYTSDGREAAKKVELPPGTPETKKPKTVLITTNRGIIKASLSADTAPCTVNSFLSLAEQGYFDDTKCHRLHVQDYFVLQCGDPTGTGQGGPGYQFDDELSGQETYTAGTLAMANGGPNTNGSQFFIVYADSGFPPSYTVFGHLNAAGVKLVQGIAKKGIGVPSNNPQLGAGDGTPKNPVVIESVK
jgi:peptidyl-prolyl cis-trans isomerase B (cyclophilin B)